MAAPEHTRPLAELRAADAARFGGKSAGLGELISAGIPVPPGFALAASAFEEHLADAGIDARVDVEPDDLAGLQAAARTAAAAVREAPVPDAVRREVAERHAELAADAVAVRSSAVGEDSAEATFAGQQETSLWIRGADAVCAAVRDCWASLYTPEAIAYRARIGEIEPAMGVAVQAMVDAAVAGVLFTCNPVNGDPSTVAVNASWGLGQAVVGGEVTPDEYRISKVTGEVLHTSTGSKEVEYGEGGVRAEVPAERRERLCLDEAGLAELVELAGRIQRHFGGHQDVEWAIDPGGALHVLQSRPVTARPRAAAPARSALDLVMGTFGVRTDRS
jgi:pyruvate, water dikinase